MSENSLKKTGMVIGIGGIISGIITASLSVPSPVTAHRGPLFIMETMLQVKLFVAIFNVALLLVLLWNYVSIYRELPNRFTLSLVVFSVALLLYALSSIPLLPLVMGFGHGSMFGPFTFLPDIFASVAVIVVLYQSYS